MTKYRVRLAVGGYPYIGGFNDRVIASIAPELDIEWVVTYWEYDNSDLQKGYT